MTRVALDLGTCNTVLARLNARTGEAETIRLQELSTPPLDGQPPLIPTALWVQDAAKGDCLAGNLALQTGHACHPQQRLHRHFKRNLMADAPGFSPTVDGVELTARWIGEQFLHATLQTLRATGETVSELVLTVPVNAFETYTQWLKNLNQAALGCPVRLLDESTAAALGYAVTTTDEPILVVDFGGGTLDISLVRLARHSKQGVSGSHVPPCAQVLGKAAAWLGGDDIDQWLLNDFLRAHDASEHELARDRGRLELLAERVKIQLSDSQEADFVYFNPEHSSVWRKTYTRDEFEQILESHHFYVRLQSALDQVLRQGDSHGLTRHDISHVLLIGGTSLIPAVSKFFRMAFPRDRLRNEKPFEAVAHGALLIDQRIQLDDFLHHGYGIRYWDPHRRAHDYEELFAPGTRYPTPTPVSLTLRASRPKQKAIELIIGEIETTPEPLGEVFFSEGTLIRQPLARTTSRIVPLNDKGEARTLATLDPPGHPGMDRLQVDFYVDENKHLRLSVKDLLSNSYLFEGRTILQLR
ncbi:MAG: Hsp70 family protein [Candidatus Sericytochromatia bacterium]|nr:Hsp70 family protein [Candidatus Sericytochromatia bacterium]